MQPISNKQQATNQFRLSDSTQTQVLEYNKIVMHVKNYRTHSHIQLLGLPVLRDYAIAEFFVYFAC